MVSPMDHEDEAERLCGEAQGLGLEVSRQEAQQLVRLMSMVWASPLGLTAIRSWADGRRKHLLDSLAWLPFAELVAGETLVDVGSGAGFPGLPVAIRMPELRVTLVEANHRKCGFLREAATTLGLSNVTVVETRAEEAAGGEALREVSDCVVARAVAPMRRLVGYLLPLCRVGGRIVMLKGPRWREEWSEAAAVAGRLGAGRMRKAEYELPEGSGSRAVVRVEKVRRTPRTYLAAPGGARRS